MVRRSVPSRIRRAVLRKERTRDPFKQAQQPTVTIFEKKTHQFVGSVAAIDGSIAPPLVGHAIAILAADEAGIRRAGGLGALLSFIRSIPAVVFAVAVPAELDASTVGARELVRRARGICIPLKKHWVVLQKVYIICTSCSRRGWPVSPCPSGQTCHFLLYSRGLLLITLGFVMVNSKGGQQDYLINFIKVQSLCLSPAHSSVIAIYSHKVPRSFCPGGTMQDDRPIR